MTSIKPCATLSLDLDNLWSYLKTHGDRAWEDFPSYLNLAVPRILDFLASRNLTITFFIVGRDAADERHREVLRAIADAGHEIGNHSFHHEPWLHLYSEAELETELSEAESHIQAATGRRPLGFRAPGFSFSATTLRVLARRGYRYDATVFPNVLNPLARAYFFATSKLTAEEKKQRATLFGTIGDALRPVKPFNWRIDGIDLLELPVTTMPVFKTPIHFSYLLYLAGFSRVLARLYFRTALAVCRLTDTVPSLLLHPLDFLGADDIQALAFFPGMRMQSGAKLGLVDEFIAQLTDRHVVMTMLQYADRIASRDSLRSLKA